MVSNRIVRHATFLLPLLLASCTTTGLAKVASTVETGYAQGGGDLTSERWSPGLDEESWAAWVSVRPLAFLEPPQAVYSVSEPKEESWALSWPVAVDASTEPPAGSGGIPWWSYLAVPLLGGGGWGGWRLVRKNGNGKRGAPITPKRPPQS